MGAIADANAGDINKIGWSRSSRTDKGVHSTGTVVSFKCRLHPEWLTDDGQLRQSCASDLVGSINDALPADVRVLCVQRTPKSFQPRRACRVRTYAYLVPGWVLCPQPDATAPPQHDAQPDEATLARFRDALRALEGSHPYHNFTSRSVYHRRRETPAADRRTMIEQRSAQRAASATARERTGLDAAEAAELSAAWDEVDAEASAPDDGNKERVPKPWELAAAGFSSGELAGWYETRFIEDGVEGADRLTPEHWRRVLDFGVEEVGTDDDGQMYVRVHVRGESFLLNQIRRMVGLAISVARGDAPMAYLEACLAAPARLYTPTSPSHTLMLWDNEFNPYRGPRAKLEEKLELTAEGARLRAAFSDAQLMPAMLESLKHDDWGYFDRVLRAFRAFIQDEMANGEGRAEPSVRRYTGVCWSPLPAVVKRAQAWHVARAAEKAPRP